MAVFVKVNVTNSPKLGIKSALFVNEFVLIMGRNSTFFNINGWSEIIQIG